MFFLDQAACSVLSRRLSESALGAGACVLANDKLYGNFNFGNSPANGTVLFNWNLATGTHSIQLAAGYVSGTTYTGIHYEVVILRGGYLRRASGFLYLDGSR